MWRGHGGPPVLIRKEGQSTEGQEQEGVGKRYSISGEDTKGSWDLAVQ